MHKDRRAEAEWLLHHCGLWDALSQCGRVHPVGSYRMDMMVWNDLDLDVENENMTREKLYRLTSFILEAFRPIWYEAKEVVGEDGKTVWFHGFETMITGELWNVDIWFFDREKIAEAARYCDGVVCGTSPEQKQHILAIKQALIRRGLYAFDQYRSMDVYKAVMDMGVTSVEEFLARYDVSQDREA